MFSMFVRPVSTNIVLEYVNLCKTTFFKHRLKPIPHRYMLGSVVLEPL